MELKSFRQILLKKAADDEQLQDLLEYIRDDLLADRVVESLKKMARLSHAAARNPNSALFHYAQQLSGGDVAQMRDALGHHISHYRGALKAMNEAKTPEEKAKIRGVADQHLNKIVPLAHLAAKMEHHSNGAIAADLPPIRAWEANYTGAGEKHKFPRNAPLVGGKVSYVDPVTGVTRQGRPGIELEGTQGWNRRLRTRPAGHDQNKSRGVYDYRYLEMPPHGAHEGVNDTNHRGGFPFEDIRVGSGDEVSAGGGHLPIEDVGNVTQFVPHEFDQHPIHDVFDIPDAKLTPEQRTDFVNRLNQWESSPNFQDWVTRHEKMSNDNPEAYAARGTKKPSHHFEGLPLADQPGHAKEGSTPAAPVAPAAAPAAPAAPAAAPTAPAAAPAQAGKFRNPEAFAKLDPKEQKSLTAFMSLPPDQKADLHYLFRDMLRRAGEE
jgi:hypothetical protein